jgi:hypothetical protein
MLRHWTLVVAGFCVLRRAGTSRADHPRSLFDIALRRQYRDLRVVLSMFRAGLYARVSMHHQKYRTAPRASLKTKI